jgi:hypothetical protein
MCQKCTKHISRSSTSASINVPITSSTIQHANHVPQTSVISHMICLYHKPSATNNAKKMYLNHQASIMYHIPSTSASTMHQTCITTGTKQVHQPCTKPQQDVPQSRYPYTYATSSINHVPMILLASASNNVSSLYQSCINYRSSYDSSIMYNITTSSTHQLHVPICSSTICQIHTPRHPTNMPLTIHHKIYQWSSHMYQPCTITDLPQKPFTTTSTKQPIVPLNMYQECASIDQ